MTYTHLAKSTNRMPGLSDFLIGFVSDFSTLAQPVGPFVAPGDSVTITTAHTPASVGLGFFRVYQTKTKHQGKGTVAGTFGSKTMKNEFDLFLPGLDAVNLEWLLNAMNEELVCLHRNGDCAEDMWFQLGDGCMYAELDPNYTTGTLEPNGEKGYQIKVKWTGIPKVYAATIPYAT